MLNLSCVREDAFILRKLYECNHTKDRVEGYGYLPLMIIPPIYDDPKLSNDWTEYYNDDTKADSWAKIPELLDNAMDEFVFMNDIAAGMPPSLNVGRCYLYGHLKRRDGDNFDLTCYKISIGDDNNSTIEYFLMDMKYRPKHLLDNGARYGWSAIPKSMQIYSNSTAHLEFLTNYIKMQDIECQDKYGISYQQRELFILMNTLIGFLSFAYLHDKYPVHVTSNKMVNSVEKRRRRKKPWAVRNAPRLVYLNTLNEVKPKTTSPTYQQIGTHASPVAHKRKGFWKTLSHEKFKYHPMYQVPNGVYVRPTIVGETDVVVDNNRYTIITGVN